MQRYRFQQVQQDRGRQTWRWAVAIIGLGVLALSFAPGWLTHHREVGGEGYRTLTLALSAWQLRSFPVLSTAVVAALATGLFAIAIPRARGVLTPVVAVPLGLLIAAAVPIGHIAHVSRVSITPGWTLLAGFTAVIGMAAVILRGSPPTGRLLVVAAATLLAVGAGGLGGRLIQLELAEGVRSHVVDGTYSREVDGVRRLLILRDGTYSLEPWSGAVETAGVSAIITDDGACPGARGFYHVRSAGGDRILWEKVVDICDDGARARALEGIWRPVTDGGG